MRPPDTRVRPGVETGAPSKAGAGNTLNQSVDLAGPFPLDLARELRRVASELAESGVDLDSPAGQEAVRESLARLPKSAIDYLARREVIREVNEAIAAEVKAGRWAYDADTGTVRRVDVDGDDAAAEDGAR